MRLAVVGNPANRRVTLFTAAAARAGLPAPAVYPWADVLTGGPVPGPGETVRIDSPGEDPEVDRLLRGAVEAARPGEIVGGAEAYGGLEKALDRIAAGGGRLLNPPGDILTMNDKRRCHAVLAAAGIPVPPALRPEFRGAEFRGAGFQGAEFQGIGSQGSGFQGAEFQGIGSQGSEFRGGEFRGYVELRAAMDAAGWRRVFVKPAHGSSASGVIALSVSGDRATATTSVEVGADGRLYNNLRVRRYDDPGTIARIVDRLAPDGLHVERWFPKAGLDDRVLDLRVVVIAGVPAHVVVRTSASPLTNLHLGNARGSVSRVRAAAGPTAWEAAMRTCADVARQFPRSLHVGVDLMFRTGWRDHAIAEVNAFGDLLTGIDTQGDEIAALLDGRYDTWSAACPA